MNDSKSHTTAPITTDISVAEALRVLLLVIGFVSFLYGFHPGAEIMISTAVTLITWREIMKEQAP